jgi:hypothetical protein
MPAFCVVCAKLCGAVSNCEDCLGYVRYCSRACQNAHWPSHKAVCNTITGYRRNHFDKVEIRVMPAWEQSKPDVMVVAHLDSNSRAIDSFQSGYTHDTSSVWFFDRMVCRATWQLPFLQQRFLLESGCVN